MFQPAIYLTHKTIRNIVTLELIEQEFKTKYQIDTSNQKNNLIIDIFKHIEQREKLPEHSDKQYINFINGKRNIKELTYVKNAYQAISAHAQSLRAEDDWNLLIRINQLMIREISSIQPTNIRGNNLPTQSKEFFTYHKFDNEMQLEHSMVEVLRWYRKSDREVNKFLRIPVLLYQLLKTSPFEKYNEETIFLCLDFWIRENRMIVPKITPLLSLMKEKRMKDYDLNDFVAWFLEISATEAKKKSFSFERRMIENKSPRKLLNLNKRQLKLLTILQVRERLSRADAAEMLEVSFMTAYRDLTGLLDKRLVKKYGRGKGTYYVLSTK